MTKTEILEAIVKKQDEKDELKDELIEILTDDEISKKRWIQYYPVEDKINIIKIEINIFKQQLSQLNSPINKPDFFDSKKDYCAKCAVKMKALNEIRYICMNPECDNYCKTE